MSAKKNEDFRNVVSDVVESLGELNRKPTSKEPEKKTEKKNIPEEATFKGIDTTEKEFKTRRVQLLLKPTIHDQLKELAEQLREETGNKKISVNEIVNQVLESFLKGVEK